MHSACTGDALHRNASDETIDDHIHATARVGKIGHNIKAVSKRLEIGETVSAWACTFIFLAPNVRSCNIGMLDKNRFLLRSIKVCIKASVFPRIDPIGRLMSVLP